MKATIAIATLLPLHAAAHSWVACTDYRVANPLQTPQGTSDKDPARRNYDDAKCHGYARDWTEYNGGGFGIDRGYNYISTPTAMCKTPRGDSGDYTAQYPKATYSPGQTVCVAYPAKNHAAAPCTNAFIPDTKFSIYRSAKGVTKDPTWPEFQENGIPHRNGVHQNGMIDYKGFQNCPDFCGAAGTDKATCSVCFTLEDDLAAGEYTFLWYWEFNGGDPYTTCWEADVVGGGGGHPNPAPVPAPHAPPTPVVKPVAGPTPGVVKPSPKPTHKPRNRKPTHKPTHKPRNGHHNKPTRNNNGGGNTGGNTGGNCAGQWQQCGGKGFTGPTCCSDAGYSCTMLNDWYSQCRP